ncbi:WhiB family transcriptional regulator [Lysinibacillus fusiformis]|uniref:WhiB family transcriptional regulator n=1 Tax=Lysinibacillus fusiformis TaxID=28031 RepID=UPI003D033C86
MTAAFRVTDRSWMDQAACRSVDPELFFPAAGYSGATAQRVCLRCPVRKACDQCADATYVSSGVWGGLTIEDRRRRAMKRLEAAA